MLFHNCHLMLCCHQVVWCHYLFQKLCRHVWKMFCEIHEGTRDPPHLVSLAKTRKSVCHSNLHLITFCLDPGPTWHCFPLRRKVVFSFYWNIRCFWQSKEENTFYASSLISFLLLYFRPVWCLRWLKNQSHQNIYIRSFQTFFTL